MIHLSMSSIFSNIKTLLFPVSAIHNLLSNTSKEPAECVKLKYLSFIPCIIFFKFN